MKSDPPAALAPDPRGDRYIDDRLVRGPEAPEVCSSPVAQHRIFAGGEHRGHPFPAQSQVRVPDCVHAAVDRVELATFEPGLDRASPKPRLKKLPTAEHAVLTLGDSGNALVDRD